MFATEEFDGYSEEVLALAIVMTAFVALVIGKYLTLDKFHILKSKIFWFSYFWENC